MERVALYIRVSTEEQAMHGLSLDAQTEALTNYARANNLFVVDYYRDEGKSARKPYNTRPECVRMLADVEAGKIDTILFIKLDRWFRNVREYFKVQEILERHNVSWRAILEDYETVTASGQFKVTIMLAVAQNEADRTSERISLVFDSKISHGTMVSGSVPYGYRLNEGKRLEIVPEQAAIIRDAFEHFVAISSQRSTLKYIRETYGVNWCVGTLRRIFQNRLYIGHYERKGRVNTEFCPAIISPELFEAAQRLIEVNVKAGPSGRVYLFSSMLVCAECGHKLTVQFSQNRTYYRCPHYYRALCPHSRGVNEATLEEWLFEHLAEVVDEYEAEWELGEAERKRAPGIDRAAIKRKLARLKDLYIEEAIDMEDYRRDYEMYTAMLSATPAPAADRPDFNAARAIVSKDYRAVYDGLSREEKRGVWHSVIKEIHVNNSLDVTRIVFL